MAKLKAYDKGGISGWLFKGLVIENNERIFENPANFLKNPVKVFKDQGATTTVLTKSPVNDLGNKKNSNAFWLIKSRKINFYFGEKLVLRWRYKRLLENINSLLISEFPVPFYYAWLFEKGKAGRYYLISEGWINGVNLALIAREKKRLFSQLVEQGLIVRLVEALADFHEAGFSHGDMKWSNIVVLEDGGFRFVDLDHVKKHVIGRSERFYFKDLARFLISAVEAGLNENQLIDIIVRYAEYRSLSYSLLIKKIMPQINKISARKNIQQLSFLRSTPKLRAKN